VLPAPPGTIDDWEFLVRLAHAMGSSIKLAGRDYGPTDPVPSTEEVLESFAGRGRITLDAVRAEPHGAVFDAADPVRALPPDPTATARFDLAPPDVIGELDLLGTTLRPWQPDDLLLAVRRRKNVLNSTGPQVASLVPARGNDVHVHPDDLTRLGFEIGQEVTVSTAHGRVTATLTSDASLRPGVITLAHGFGGVGPDGARVGSNVNEMLSSTEQLQPISAMPLLTAVPVTLEPAPRSAGAR
jgi:anaerobic selenocysteine-containing dehydrogenase